MSELRPFALVRDGDQWMRCAFDGCFLDREAGIIELAWETIPHDGTTETPPLGAGLAFDAECRLYHSRPDEGQVDRVQWSAALAPGIAATIWPLFINAERAFGDFARSGTSGGPADPLAAPRGLAVDENDRLYVAATDADTVLIFDLWGERLLRRVGFTGGRPTDVAAHGAIVYAALPGLGQVVRFTARSSPVSVSLPPECLAPSRIAVAPDGTIAVLAQSATAAARVWFVGSTPLASVPTPFASDVEWESQSVLVVAGSAGADFQRYRLGAAEQSVLEPLRARGYDGLGIVAIPSLVSRGRDEPCHCAPSAGTCHCESGRTIGYWSASGFRRATAAHVEYVSVGEVTTYRLDSGAYQTIWGRIFFDACIPDGTSIRIHAITGDEVSGDELYRAAPKNVLQATVVRPDLSPPMPPQVLVPAAGTCEKQLHRRESGRELPWAQPFADDPFVTFEAPINAPPGRHLWVTVELRGNTRLTPRVKCLRAEHPSHDYLRRLPRTFSRMEDVAAFLRRYLAIFEGFLGEIEARSVDRSILLNPCSTPDEMLPWLAGFLGLVLDERWARAPRPGGRTVDARRAIIKEAAGLLRFRGTVPGLKRLLELYLGVEVVLLEHYRLRGIGGAVLGTSTGAFTNSVLGGGFRVGGSVGVEGEAPLARSLADAFQTHAHRFSVLIPATLTTEQRDVVRDILKIHRPAHTMFDVCTVGTGMRVGIGLHVQLSSIVGRTGGFATLQLGSSTLGRGGILGRPIAGTTVGTSPLGTSRIE